METLFSQLCDKFFICNDYAKTFKIFLNKKFIKKIALTVV